MAIGRFFFLSRKIVEPSLWSDNKMWLFTIRINRRMEYLYKNKRLESPKNECVARCCVLIIHFLLWWQGRNRKMWISIFAFIYFDNRRTETVPFEAAYDCSCWVLFNLICNADTGNVFDRDDGLIRNRFRRRARPRSCVHDGLSSPPAAVDTKCIYFAVLRLLITEKSPSVE